MTPDLKEAIDVFLEDRRECDGGGWAEVTESDMTLLSVILDKLIEEKSDPDADNDMTIEYKLFNRRTTNRNSFWTLPYKTQNPMDMLRMCRDNMSRAMEDFQREFGKFELDRLMEEKKVRK